MSRKDDDIRKFLEKIKHECVTMRELSRFNQLESEFFAPPPPEMETVEVTAGWINIYKETAVKGQMLGRYSFATEQAANEGAENGRIECREIKVEVQRPKKQPVERTKRGQFQLDGNFRESGIPSNTHYGKEVTISWEETR